MSDILVRDIPIVGPARAAEVGRPPVIGITATHHQARWGAWDSRAVLLPSRYADAVATAGGIPVLIPPVSGAAALGRTLDGLILSGGGDIDPDQYGQAPHPANGPVDCDRDAAELGLLTTAMQAGLPVLGICRGVQLVNVALGGTLHQHLPDLVGHDGHAPLSGHYGTHRVRVAANTALATALDGTDDRDLERDVPTNHHQAIDKLGAGLVATAWADDGTVEAVEFEPGTGSGEDSGFLLAVQWHPEAGDDPSLFRALVKAAAEHSDRSGRQ